MKSIAKILSWIVSITLPVVIVLFVVRLVLNPWYPELEYRTPGFPEDPYGFNIQDRLRYSKIAIDYLVNSEDISFLGDLRFPEGQQAPEFSCQFMNDCTLLYNERELEHMVDVKNVVQASMDVLTVGIAILVIFALLAWKGSWLDAYLIGIQRGGLLVLALIGMIILLVLVAFNYIFVVFHQIFFTEGTWSFYYSDTLIRLFPQRFWQDTFLIVGGLSIGIGLTIYFIIRKVRQREAATD